MEQEALYPFGYGLSYTSFTYEKREVIQEVDGVKVKVLLQNTGRMRGTETVQVYVKALRPGTPNVQLKGIRKVALAPGEKQEVCVFLPWEAFSLCGEDGARRVEDGPYMVYVGGSQPDMRSEKLTGMCIPGIPIEISKN